MENKAHCKPTPARTIFAGLLVIFLFLTIQAQSGRRVQKSAPTPTPEPSPEAKPSPKRAPADTPQIGLILGIADDSFSHVPLYYYDSVLQSCADRLNEAPSIGLDVSGKRMSRSDAIRTAKSQKEGYVAALELRNDQMIGSNQNPYDGLVIEYTLFAPGTAKVVASGRAYQRLSKTRGVIPTPGRTSTVYTEQMLKQAARDAADRIMNALHVLPRR
ncbi:MAG TPA: hypothetical protein VE135_19080 [Pyrinomonadaceae bacterium]|nr:hypothetical protein [Pyrinomonadaceae bacterium]